MELELIGLVEETVDASLRYVSNNALIVIGMMAMEVFRLFPFHDTIFTRPARFLSSQSRDPMNIILGEEILISLFDHTFGYEHNVNRVREIG